MHLYSVHCADKIAKDLNRVGIETAAIHGNKSQNQRQLALNNFKEGNIRVLVATDIAARGIDIGELSHVINYDLPDVPETYVHRIGRTGRAGSTGVAITFCDSEELPMFRNIEKVIGKSIPVLAEEKFEIINIVPPVIKQSADRGKSNNHNGRKSRRYHGKGKEQRDRNDKTGNGKRYRKTNSSNKVAKK